MGALRLTLLGGFQAALGSEPILRLPTKKAQALLAYLAVQPGQACTREKLAGLLWGDLDDEHARSNLRQTLFGLRQSLSHATPPCLVGEGETVLLRASPVEVDVIAFERCAREGSPGALEKAAVLYRGDLLDGFAVAEAPFDEWLSIERERLRAMATEVLTRLLAHQVKARAAASAVQTALRLIALDPLQEAVHRELMGLYAGQGRWAAALKQYQSCVDLLQRELGVDPEPDTRKLYQGLLQKRRVRTAGSGLAGPTTPRPGPEERTPTYGSAPETKLVGRDRELIRLREAMEEAWRSRGGVVALVGEAGIGKTRVAEEIAGEAARRGGKVILGRCHESEQILPFGPWVDAVRRGRVLDDREALAGLGGTWRRELARLFPEAAEAQTDRSSELAQYLRLFEAIARLLDTLAARQPLLLFLEDLHWADEMSLRLLSFIGRRVPRWRILILGTARSEEVADAPALRQAMQELRKDRCLTEVSLPRLSRDETRALVRCLKPSRAEAIPLPFVDHVWTVSEGNPFMIVESIRALRGGAPPRTDHIALPERIHHLLTDRLDRLGEASRLLAAIAAIIGRDFDFTLLQRAAGLDEGQAAEGVEELVRRGVMRAVGERFQFAHDWMREVADAQVLSPTRGVLHRKVGAALEGVHANNLEPHYAALGFHYEQGEAWQKALTYLRRAGLQAAARLAHGEAASFLERALAVLARLKQALGTLGRFPEIRETTELTIDIHIDLRNTVLPLGDQARMGEHLHEAEVLARTLGDQHRIARVATFMVIQCLLTGRYDEAVRFGQEALSIARTLGDRAIEVVATTFLGQTYAARGEFGEAATLLERNVALQGDLRYERFGAPLIQCAFSGALLSDALSELGRFDGAIRHAEAAVQIAETADHPFTLHWGLLGLGLVHLRRGDLPGATRVLERNLELCRTWQLIAWTPVVAAFLGAAYALAGHPDTAFPLLGGAVQELRVAHMHRRPDILLWAGLAYVPTGRINEAARHAQEALALSRRLGARGSEAHALCLAGDAASAGSAEDAERSYREALALADTLDMRPLVAHCHLGLGKLYWRMGKRQEAQEHLTTARAMYGEMDMRFWLEKAGSEIEALH